MTGLETCMRLQSCAVISHLPSKVAMVVDFVLVCGDDGIQALGDLHEFGAYLHANEVLLEGQQNPLQFFSRTIFFRHINTESPKGV